MLHPLPLLSLDNVGYHLDPFTASWHHGIMAWNKAWVVINNTPVLTFDLATSSIGLCAGLGY
jgi:hypothetical protein